MQNGGICVQLTDELRQRKRKVIVRIVAIAVVQFRFPIPADRVSPLFTTTPPYTLPDT